MNSLTDQQLLRDYTGRRSEVAFAELVRRYVDFVYSAALRMVRDAHLAEDVTQSVFVALAQNARQLADHAVLSGWLHRTTQNLAANAVRADVRRRAREQEAAAMNELLSAEPETIWEHIAPQLDEALGELNEGDRDALLLRYFERRSAREMAQTLGTSEDAAQKRVSRAVERLREFFAKRGITVGASGLVVVITANAVQAAPVGLAATIAAAAALAGTAIATTATATAAATKAIVMTTLQKTIIAATFVAAVGTGIYEACQASTLRSQVQTLQQQPVEQTQQLQREREDFARQLTILRDENERLNRNTAELVKLRGEAARMRRDSKEYATLKAGNANTPTEVAMKDWLNRASQLKQYLVQMPDKGIPELQFCTEEDWLNAVKGNKLAKDQDVREALNAMRQFGKDKFSQHLAKAVSAYVQANSGFVPTDVSQLKPYFDFPVEDTLLQRYVMLRTGKASDLEGKWLITEKAPVDSMYDTRTYFGINTGMLVDVQAYSKGVSDPDQGAKILSGNSEIIPK